MAALPAIPAKRYFTIGEVAELCDVKPYVLRYWEQEFSQLRPMKRRGNRRYYQHHEVLLVRRIRSLLYEEGFTISGARNRLAGEPAHRLDEASPHEMGHAHAAPSLESQDDPADEPKVPARSPAPASGRHPGQHPDQQACKTQEPVTATPPATPPSPEAKVGTSSGPEGQAAGTARGLHPLSPLDWQVIRRELEEIRDHLLR